MILCISDLVEQEQETHKDLEQAYLIGCAQCNTDWDSVQEVTK